MKNYEELNGILMDNIRKLKELDIKDEYARDEIMRGNAIQSTAKAMVQLEVIKLAIDKQEERRRMIYDTNFMDE